MPRTSADIRREFIDFFVKQHGHTFVASSPVVPHDDPTLLFANAGMNQFKPYFLGTQKAPWPRVANSQKCIRAGGKHNDLDDVGRSRRHHTFFEMLGNWSFGDYFKAGAIEMAWELLTKVWGLDPTRLHVTCYEGDEKNGVPRDTEAADLWKKIAAMPDDHIHYFGKDNFWEMGDTGPCGPCTEIHIDRTEDRSGGPLVNGTDPRVMEIWNLVFIQYNRDAAGKLTTLPAQHVDTGMGFERIVQVIQNRKDNYDTDLWTPLFDAISQLSNLKYTGQFPPTNAADPELEAANAQLRTDIAFRVVADHLRCLTFALTDGAVPSNEGRGYVLRRILRRAVRFGRQNLNLREPFMHKLVPVVVDSMADMFPELKKNPQHVTDIIKDEEIGFGRTLDRGIDLAEESAWRAVISSLSAKQWELKGARTLFDLKASGYTYTLPANPATEMTYIDAAARAVAADPAAMFIAYKVPNSPLDTFGRSELGLVRMQKYCGGTASISAADAFKLYDTYGFPIDLTRIMAEERGMTVDLAGYEKLMEEAKERSRGVDKTGGGTGVFDLPPTILDELQKLNVHPTDDSHKFHRAPARATVRAIWNGTDLEQSADSGEVRAGQRIAVILDKTNFYAEMGGQIGDAGELRADSDTAATRSKGSAAFIVETTRIVGGYILHIGHVKSGRIDTGDAVTAIVMGGRERTEKNHTATHLANWALRETLGGHVQQKGSLVDPEKLRFDFVQPKAMTDSEIAAVEKMVNESIDMKMPVYAEVAPQEQALKIHSLRAVFGEKYPPMVRVVSIGVPLKDLLADPANARWQEYSIEFCGGTHLPNTGDVERFAITAEESVAKGIRRLVALTGASARDAITQGQVIESLIAQAKGAPDSALPTQIAALQKSIAGGAGTTVPLLSKRRAQTAIADLQERLKKWQRTQTDSEARTQNSELGGGGAESLLASAEPVNGISLIVARVPDSSAENLRNTWDWLKKKHPQQNIAVLLASEFTDTDKDGHKLPPKVNLLAAVGDPHISKLKAGDWVKAIAPIVGGSGGGRPQLAMAGGKETAKIDDALAAAKTFARQKLA